MWYLAGVGFIRGLAGRDLNDPFVRWTLWHGTVLLTLCLLAVGDALAGPPGVRGGLAASVAVWVFAGLTGRPCHSPP
jgi:hypothetical protein